jgi:two-component system chemotaxis response regulator CheB
MTESSQVADERLRVLVVDDSAVVRQVMSLLLGRHGMAVDVASDPLIAIERIKKARPDVIVLDLEMPRMNGATFLQRLHCEDPIPIVLCTGASDAAVDAAATLAGPGVRVVRKPKVGLSAFLHETADAFVDAVRTSARERPSRIEGQAAYVDGLIAIGASTGGPRAVRTILEAMPKDAPPILIVQHMPATFTRAFAEQLDAVCAIDVREARDGDRLRSGRALVAPGDKHLRVERRGGRLYANVNSGPFVSRHRPSVDVLFHSVARECGPAAIGVLLTGMGDDGADGLHAMQRAGALTLAQDRESSVVFGMAAQAIRRGAADGVLPLGEMAGAILKSGLRGAPPSIRVKV